MMRIMIVDDSVRMREMIRMFVHPENDIVCECADGAEAVSSFPKFLPDVVLMDIEMGPMDGFEATEKIYQIDPAAKIIFVTSHGTSAFRQKAQGLHAAGYVTKENLSELGQLLQH